MRRDGPAPATPGRGPAKLKAIKPSKRKGVASGAAGSRERVTPGEVEAPAKGSGKVAAGPTEAAEDVINEGRESSVSTAKGKGSGKGKGESSPEGKGKSKCSSQWPWASSACR